MKEVMQPQEIKSQGEAEKNLAAPSGQPIQDNSLDDLHRVLDMLDPISTVTLSVRGLNAEANAISKSRVILDSMIVRIEATAPSLSTDRISWNAAVEICAEMAREAATRAAACRSQDITNYSVIARYEGMSDALREAQRRIADAQPPITPQVDQTDQGSCSTELATAPAETLRAAEAADDLTRPLPCPFCGSSTAPRLDWDNSGAEDVWYVVCGTDGCGARSQVFGTYESDYCVKALAAWNARYPITQATATASALSRGVPGHGPASLPESDSLSDDTAEGSVHPDTYNPNARHCAVCTAKLGRATFHLPPLCASPESGVSTDHIPDCRWQRTSKEKCAYRETHHYCPHPEHACTCPSVWAWADPECPTLDEAEAALRSQGINPADLPNQFIEHLGKRLSSLRTELEAARTRIAELGAGKS